MLRRLADMQYKRNELDLTQGTYRVRGDVIDIFPAESEREALRVELFDDEIESLVLFDPLTGEVQAQGAALHGVPVDALRDAAASGWSRAVDEIRDELHERLQRAEERRQAGRSAAARAAHALRSSR